jgi:2-polyprenyl-3-methyl-5-hydroxy-6-metoxy-1,4-benzoquinol methylase
MPFDKQYYQRFYTDPKTSVTSRSEMQRRAALIAAAVNYLDLPVRRILDAGCGLGLLRAPLLREFRRAAYTGLEMSQYLCQRYGWQQGTMQDWRTRQRFELVVCYDVMQYLTAKEAVLAIAKLALWCRGVLYFSALTREDWLYNCDQSRTDKVPGIRRGNWYRRELQKYFSPMGCGLWLRKDSPIVAWEMDQAALVR